MTGVQTCALPIRPIFYYIIYAKELKIDINLILKILEIDKSTEELFEDYFQLKVINGYADNSKKKLVFDFEFIEPSCQKLTIIKILIKYILSVDKILDLLTRLKSDISCNDNLLAETNVIEAIK